MSKPHETTNNDGTPPIPSGDDPSDAHESFRAPLGEDALSQLRSYQVLTIPPSARRALMSAELPGASPDLLNDTLPPRRENVHVEPSLDAPSVSTRRTRRLRAVVAILAGLLLTFTLLAVLTRPTEPRGTTDTSVRRPALDPLPRTLPEARLSPPKALAVAVSSVAPVSPVAPPSHPPRAPAKKSATQPRSVPMEQPSVHTTPSPASSPVVAPATLPPSATPGAGPRPGFRLGSR
jgi:hypothetical protein